MNDLKILSEITTRYGSRNINELEFKTPEDFAAYKKKHKMRPGTVVKVAGKDKVVDAPKGKKTKASGIEFSSFGKKDIKRFADRYGVEVSNIRSGQQGNLADFEGDPQKIKKMLTSTQYGMEPEDANDLLGIKDKPKVDKKTDKDMASAADKANMKMDRDEIMGVLNAKNEPFAEEVYDILDDKFKKMGSLGKELKQKIDTLASYEMGIYDMSEKEYEQGREELKKKLGDYYKEQGLDEGIKELSKITTRYTNRLDEAGVPNHLRAGFKKLKNVEGLSIEERDELTDAYRKLVDLLTYGKFYENGKPNQRRKELSELTFDIQYALVGSKRLKPQNSQRKFESIWKKFTNMINTQIKIEEKGKQGNYIKAIRASKLDDVVDMFKRNTQRSTRKQKDLL